MKNRLLKMLHAAKASIADRALTRNRIRRMLRAARGSIAGAALTGSRSRKLIAIAIATLGIVTLIAVWNQPALLRVPTLLSLLLEKTPPKLVVPVQEVAAGELTDTWGAPRGIDRRHEGIDIFAPKGRSVISTTNGVVFKVGENNLGGNVVRVLGPGWRWHYYAHLDRFADIKPGSKVQPGTVLGYVGNTGNARGTPYHLHYGIYDFMGIARNPYPLLADDRTEPKVVKASRKEVKRKASPRRNSPSKKRSAPGKSESVAKSKSADKSKSARASKSADKSQSARASKSAGKSKSPSSTATRRSSRAGVTAGS